MSDRRLFSQPCESKNVLPSNRSCELHSPSDGLGLLRCVGFTGVRRCGAVTADPRPALTSSCGAVLRPGLAAPLQRLQQLWPSTHIQLNTQINTTDLSDRDWDETDGRKTVKIWINNITKFKSINWITEKINNTSTMHNIN